MIHPWKTKAAQYAIQYNGKEYVFYVRGDGTGVCAALNDAWEVISYPFQDRLAALLAALSMPSEYRRAASIEEEFSCDVQLPTKIARRIWRAWTLTKAMGTKNSTEVQIEIGLLSEWLDEALQPFVREHFGPPSTEFGRDLPFD